MEVQGHRGAGVLVPENTLLAFRYAIKQKYNAVEMDLWMTKDKQAVVIHGGHSGKPEPDTLTLEELRKDCEDPDLQVPLLKDVLSLLSEANMLAQLELKGPLTDPSVFLEIISSTFGEKAKDLIQFSGFQPSYQTIMKTLAPEIPRSLTFRSEIPEDWLEQAQLLDSIYVDFNFAKITEDVVKKAHENGLKVMAWFPGTHKDTEEELQRLIDLNVDRVCANHPDKLQNLLNNQ